jgi:hypothetical protein
LNRSRASAERALSGNLLRNSSNIAGERPSLIAFQTISSVAGGAGGGAAAAARSFHSSSRRDSAAETCELLEYFAEYSSKIAGSCDSLIAFQTISSAGGGGGA